MAGRNLFAGQPIEPVAQTEQPVEPSQQQGRNLFANQEPRELPEGGMLESITEPVQAITAGMAGTIGGGLAGAVSAPFVGSQGATEVIEGVQQAATEWGAPETQAGQRSLETIGDIMQTGVDIARFPISGLAGLAELLTGQGPEQAAETIKSVQEQGVGKTAGRRVFEETGSPLLAAAAETSPEAALSLIPIKGMAAKRSALKQRVASDIKAASAQPEVGMQIKSLATDIKSGKLMPDEITSRVKQIEGQVSDKAGVGTYKRLEKLADQAKTGSQGAVDKLSEFADDVAKPQADKTIARYMLEGTNKVKNDPLARDAIKQGFDPGVVSAIKGASPADRANMAKMVERMQQYKNNPMTRRRPTDIAGQSLVERVNHIKKVNKQAGEEVNKAAKSLRGQRVDFQKPINNFMDNLDEIGVSIGDDLKPRFTGSDLEGLSGPETVINNVVRRMSAGVKGKAPDAYELHRLKRYIDENVTYGKAGEGIKGQTERILKQLRNDVDDALDRNFPDYNEANSVYSETIGALDSIQDVAGRKMDLFGPNSDKAVGTLLRRMMGNAQSRVNLYDAVDDLDSIAKKYGGNFSDDLTTQMVFADELDKIFGTTARTSLAGEMAKETRRGRKAAEMATGRRGMAETALDVGEAGVEKLRGINEEGAFKAINKLLERQPDGK